MKNEKGITIISLIVYVIILTFVIAGVTSITAHFYGNMNEMDKTSKSSAFAKFNMIFLNDIKSEGAKIEEPTSSSGVQLNLLHIGKDGTSETIRYTIQGNSVYRNSVKICNGVKERKNNSKCVKWNRYNLFKNK